jgi:hypothetical protein
MKIYLAATNDQYTNRASCRVRRLLVSYHKGTRNTLMDGWKNSGSPKDWCVDSGAHLYIRRFWDEKICPPLREAEEHVASLAELARKVRPTFLVEADLQDLYGDDVIRAWRRDIWKPLEQSTGVKICYVWHAHDNLDGWRRMLDDPDMGFLGIAAGAAVVQRIAPEMVSSAYKVKKPVHGFAQVRRMSLQKVPFYSVDSTSWSASSLYGLIPSLNIKSGGSFSNKHAGKGEMKRGRGKAALGVMAARTKGRVGAADMLGKGGCSDSTYQWAADVYMSAERFFDAYWEARGFNWGEQLSESDPTNP